MYEPSRNMFLKSPHYVLNVIINLYIIKEISNEMHLDRAYFTMQDLSEYQYQRSLLFF